MPTSSRVEQVHGQIHAGADKADGGLLYGYSVAQTMAQVLKQCGDDLSRDNIMKQAANIHAFPRRDRYCRASTSTPARPTTIPIRGMVLGRFDGKSWVNFSDVITAD